MAVPPPSTPAPPHAGKAALRRALRADRVRFVAALPDRAAAEAALHARLVPLLDGDGPIAGYAAHRGEPDVLPFLLRAFDHGLAIALPHVDAAGAMSFAAWYPGATLGAHASGLPQPPDPGELVPRVLLVPLVGFDRAGRRLGQGGGFYDRWAAAHPTARRIGIAWSVQERPAIPADPWDMPLDAIATEAEWIVP